MVSFTKEERNAISMAIADFLSDRSEEELRQPKFMAMQRALYKLNKG